MSFLTAIRKLWHSVAPRTHSDVEEEFRSTLDAYEEDLVRQGLSEAEARRKARIGLGRPSAQNEIYRDAIGLRLFDELGGDVRYGLRALRRNPGFAVVAMLSLALGIGATTAMFSLIYAVQLHPFPYDGADRIMNPLFINQQHPDEFQWFTLSKAECDDLSLAAPVDSVLGFNNSHLEITGGALPEDIWGVYLTENAGTFFGVRPLLGRNLESSDADNGGQSVVVLNYRFWQSYFGGDPHVIGRTLEMDHAPYAVLRVTDTGPDLSTHSWPELVKLWEKEDSRLEGNGHAFWVVRREVERNNGFVRCSRAAPRGTVMEIFLPSCRPVEEPMPRLQPQLIKTPEETTILVLSSDWVGREVAAEFLRAEKYQVLEASSPDEGIAKAKGQGVRIDLIFADEWMQGWMEKVVLPRLGRRRNPPAVLYTHWSSQRPMPHLARLKIPYLRHELISRVREMLGQTREERLLGAFPLKNLMKMDKIQMCEEAHKQ